jgi:heat-inducible transcriptional repressor
LSGLTEYTSVATQELPTQTRIQHIHLAPVTDRRLVMLVVLSNGQVEHRMLEMSQSVRPNSLESLSNYLMAQFCGTELARLRPKDEELLPPELQASRQLVSSIFMVLRQIARDSLVTHLFVEGQIKMLNQPEFASASRFQQFLLLMDNERSLLRMISRSPGGNDPEITIGEENMWEPMRELSIITHSYGVGQEAFGRIGVIGPTRMDYPKALRAVRAVAKKLSEILGKVVSG